MFLAICAFAINLIAGSKTVEALTGLDAGIVSLLMVLIAILYSFRTGLKATVMTEMIKMVVVWTGAIILVPWVIINAGGWDVVVAGLGGKSGLGANAQIASNIISTTNRDCTLPEYLCLR